MILRPQGVNRPFAHLSSWVVIFLLLTAPAAFAQQEKTKLTPKSQVVSETNDRIAQLAKATSVTETDYPIGSGDLVTIEVFDVPELSRDVRVNEMGYISLPLMPTKIRAAGLTTGQLQEKLAELLQTNGLVSTPEVTVTLKERNSQPITVIGSVKTPMVIQAVHSTTLIEALSQAGGVADDAGNTVIVTRPARNPLDPPDNGESAAPANAPADAQTFTINLSDLLETGDSRFNILLLGGDVVSVPRAGIIYVVGAVNHPGGFVMLNDRDRMTTLKMLSLAGGPISSAKIKDAVILRKNPATGKRDEVPVDLNKVMKLKTEDVTLEASDILYIPDSAGKRALHEAGQAALTLTTGVAIVSAGRY
ncbi:MAG: polysaccharide biosynthesis/export family protein [Candidatus Acidiferrales bacterium]